MVSSIIKPFLIIGLVNMPAHFFIMEENVNPNGVHPYSLPFTTSDPDAMGVNWSDLALNREGNDLFGQIFNPGRQQDKEFAQSMYAWQQNNEYNTYAAKMQRAADAGLNPFLAVNDSNMAAAASPSSSAVGSGASSLTSLAGSLGSLAGAFKDTSEGIGHFKDNKWIDPRNEANIAVLNATTDELASRAGLNRWQSRKLAKDIWQIEQLTPWMRSKLINESNEVIKRMDEIDATIRNLEADTELKGEQRGDTEQSKLLKQKENLMQDLRVRLAQMFGVDINTPWLNQVISAGLSGHGSDVLKALGSLLSDIGSVFAGSIKGLIPKKTPTEIVSTPSGPQKKISVKPKKYWKDMRSNFKYEYKLMKDRRYKDLSEEQAFHKWLRDKYGQSMLDDYLLYLNG